MQTIQYITSLLRFYLKSEIKSEQNFIIFKKPNTVLYFIPFGAKTEKIAINQISSVATNFRMRISSLLFGLFVLLLALSMFSTSSYSSDSSYVAIRFIFLLIGVLNILNAFKTTLVVTMTSGQEKLIYFFIFEKSKANLAVQQINDMISGRLDDTNSRQQTDRIVDAINNK